MDEDVQEKIRQAGEEVFRAAVVAVPGVRKKPTNGKDFALDVVLGDREYPTAWFVLRANRDGHLTVQIMRPFGFYFFGKFQLLGDRWIAEGSFPEQIARLLETYPPEGLTNPEFVGKMATFIQNWVRDFTAGH